MCNSRIHPPTQILFGTVSSGYYNPAMTLRRATWVFLHLLQFCVSNQTSDPEEDRRNKPWRPIPSGRITLAQAQGLRCLLFLLCFAISAQYDVLGAGIVLSAATIAHNEFGMGAHWFSRNALNAIGYASFSAGSLYAGCPRTLTPNSFL